MQEKYITHMRGDSRISEIINFVVRGEESKDIASMVFQYGEYDSRLICIEILSWMKRVYRNRRVKVKNMSEFVRRDGAVRSIVSSNELFSSLFEINGDNFSLFHGLAQEDVDLILNAVNDEYRPIVFVTRGRAPS